MGGNVRQLAAAPTSEGHRGRVEAPLAGHSQDAQCHPKRGTEEDFAFICLGCHNKKLSSAGNVWDRITNKKHVSKLWWRSGKDFDELFHPRHWATWDWNKERAKTGPPVPSGPVLSGSSSSGTMWQAPNQWSDALPPPPPERMHDGPVRHPPPPPVHA